MKNKKRAYTLVEVVVTLSVLIVVIALVMSLIFVVSNTSKKVEHDNMCLAEYQSANRYC